jgi:hypothetical protein
MRSVTLVWIDVYDGSIRTADLFVELGLRLNHSKVFLHHFPLD